MPKTTSRTDINKEVHKRKFYLTLKRMSLAHIDLNPQDYLNIYIDDYGYVVSIMPDGVVSDLGVMSITGEDICTQSD